VAAIYFDSLHHALVTRVFEQVHFHTRQRPKYLCHYTTERGFQGVIADNRFRATSADSSSDRKEISYGCDLFAKLVDVKTASRTVSNFTGKVLNELKSFPGERVGKIFLASFCERDDCLTLWNGYGGYSLRFPIETHNSVFLSAPRGLATGQGFATQLVPAIYDKNEQQTALGLLLDLLTETLEDRSLIVVSDAGPWAHALASFVALTVSDFALSFIACLKNPAFEDEREWRIVARPCITPFSSDPMEADRNCECYIKTNWSKPYVELTATEPEALLIPGAVFGLPTPPLKLPIDAVRIGPCKESKGMVERACQLLHKHGFQVAPVLESEIPTLLDCH
jgi:hypothetical protein